MVKKLAGKAANTAAWCTNVGNEFGQVLMSVFTDTEGDSLGDMEWMSRYLYKFNPTVGMLFWQS